MELTPDEKEMLGGKVGFAVRKSMEILVALGEIYGARRLLDVSSVQVAGVSYDNLGDAGLEFLLFEPKPEVRKEFYAEIPVAINVTGGYHDMAIFLDKIARLSRIVNVKDISMGRTKGGEDLNTSCTAVTYKFVEGPPPEDPKDKKKKKKKRRKKK